MGYQIVDFFDSLEDCRRSQGMRHRFHDMLTIIIMAILSGHQGLRGFSRFAEHNAAELTAALELKHGVPSYGTFQSFLNAMDEQIYVRKFIHWMRRSLPDAADDAIALDGKAIRYTAKGGNTKFQNFVSVVNAFGHQSGLVYGMKSFENGKSGEAEALRTLIGQLGLSGKTFAMDALHCQKKRLISSGS